MEQEPYVHVFQKSNGVWNGVCALQLKACPVERGEENLRRDEIVARYLRRQVDLINALYCPSLARSYALRYLSLPHPASFAAGEVVVVLLGMIEDTDAAACHEQARLLCRELGALLGAMMPDYVWHIVKEADQFERVWAPLDWETAYVAEVRRREDRFSLETVRPRPMLGRGRMSPEQLGDPSEGIYFVHAFVPPPSTQARLLRAMLLQPAPILLQVALAPVRLSSQEEEAMVAELSRVEHYLQRRDALAQQGAAVATPTVLTRRAEVICGELLRQLLLLQDAPFLMHILLASAHPLSPTLLETVGVEVTSPVGLNYGSALDVVSDLQRGGYDVIIPSCETERETALSNLRLLEFTPWGSSLAPEPLCRVRWLVDAQEASGAFRFPIATSEGLPGMEVRSARMRAVPREASIRWQQAPSEVRTQIGESPYLGYTEPVFLLEDDRRQHLYIIGQTGTGKTTLLKKMITADIEAGRGLAVIDPHGDLFEELLTYIPSSRLDDLVILDPTDTERPVGLNVLECAPEQRFFVVREMRSIMERLIEDQYGASAAEFAGPVFYQHLQKSLLWVMSNPNDPGTLLEFYEIYQTKDFWRKWLPLPTSDPLLERWQEFLEDFDPTERYSEGLSWGEWISSKFEDFVLDPKLRLIFGQKRSTINLRQIMDEGKILLVNLAKGELSEANSRFLGMVLMAKILEAAMERVSLPPEQRRTFYLYVDEFQALATASFTLLLSEARKFGVGLVLANQFLSQVKDERIVQSIFGNVGTIISFRVGRADAEALEPYFAPYFDATDLTSLPNWYACARFNVLGQSVTPFTLRTMLLGSLPQPKNAQKGREFSRQRYGRPRRDVEKEIQRSLEYSH